MGGSPGCGRWEGGKGGVRKRKKVGLLVRVVVNCLAWPGRRDKSLVRRGKLGNFGIEG